MKGNKVEIWFQKSSAPIVFSSVQVCYQKGDLFCVEMGEYRYKYPLRHLFCIKETVIPELSSKPKEE